MRQEKVGIHGSHLSIWFLIGNVWEKQGGETLLMGEAVLQGTELPFLCALHIFLCALHTWGKPSLVKQILP